MFKRGWIVVGLILLASALSGWAQGIVGPGQMDLCDQATFTITVSNGSVSQDACLIRVTNTVPNSGFSYVPGSATITLNETAESFTSDPAGDVWDIDTIVGAPYALPPGETITLTFDLATDCSAISGTNIVTVDFEDCADPGVPLQNISSTSIEILPGAIIVSKTPSTTSAAVGDLVTWTITVENTGLGTVKNVVITDLLGPGLAFDSTPDGGVNAGQETVWDPSTTPSLAELAVGESASVQLTAELISCAGLYNDVDARWGCETGPACDDTAVDGGTATASITLIVADPNLSFEAPNAVVPYCGNAEGIEIAIVNSGAGTARQVQLCCSLALLQVANVQGGATYSDGCFSIPDIPPGETYVLTFDGLYTGDWCAGGPSGLNVFTLNYANDCGIPFLGRPKFSTCSSEPGPSLVVNKSGPETLRLGETGSYDLSVAYVGSTSCGSSPGPVTIVDTYPEGFTLLDAAGGVHDPGARTLTWTYDPNTEPPFAATIQLEAPTGCGACATPAGGTDPNTLVATGTDCCGCAISGSAEVPTTILCEGFGDDTAYFTSSISLSTDTAIRCMTPAILTVTHTYTFISDAALNDFLLNEFTYFVDGNGDLQYEPGTASVTGGTLGSIVDNTPAGRLELPLTDSGSVSGRTLVYSYDLRVLGLDDPSCQSTNYPIYAGIDLQPDATSIGYCGTMYADPPAPFVTAQPPSMSVAIDGVPVIQEDCATYDITVTVTRTSALAVPYDARLVLTNAGGSIITFPEPAACSGVLAVDGTDCRSPIVGASSYEWRFADGFESGNTATIPIQVTVPCDGPLIDLAATVFFDDLCNNDTVYDDSCSSSTTSSSALTLAADVYTRKSPEILYATEKFVQWTVVVQNTGNGVAYNTWVDDVLGSGLVYDAASSDPAGAAEFVNQDHHGGSINGVSYVFDELQPGESRTITVGAELVACDGLTNDIAVSWGCGGGDCQPPRTDDSIVVIPISNLVATSFSPTPIPMCSENPATVTAKNAGVTTVYDIVANVTLPDGLLYAGNPEVSLDSGSTWLPASEPSISGQELTWTQAEISALAEIASKDVVMIRFDYIVDCAFEGGDLTFQAGYEDPCGSPKETGIGRFTINLTPAEVSTTLRQVSPAPGEALDCGGQATWEIDVVNEGSIVVPVIRVEAVLADGLTFVNAQGDPVYGPSDDGSNVGQIVTWEIADFPIDATATLRLTAASALGGLDCEALDVNVHATWGCGLVDGTSFTNDADCLTDAPASATISGVRRPPVDLTATLSPDTIEGCADTSTLTLEIQNTSTTGTISNVDVQIDLPAQLSYATGTTQIDCGGGYAGGDDPSEAGSLLTWYDIAVDGGPDDLCTTILPGDTIRLQFDVDILCYFSTRSIPITVRYKDCCGLSQYTATTNATLTAAIPNLSVSKTPDVTGLDCANPLDEVTWTIRVTNNGAGTADVVRIEDTLGIDLVHVSGGTQLGGDPQAYGWEFGPLAPGAFQEVTLTARLAAPPENCDVTRRTNTARAIWGCGAFDGDPNTTAEYTCPGTIWRQDTAIVQIANLAVGEADIVPIFTCEGDGIGSGALQITVRNTNDGQISQDFSIAIGESTTGWSVTDTFTNLGGSLPIGSNSAQTLTIPGWPVACSDCAYQFTVTVDTTGTVCECAEGNNTTILDYILTTPNLVLDAADLSVACSGDGSIRIQGPVTVRNAGCGEPLTGTIPVRVTVYDAAGCAGNVLDQFTVDFTGADVAAGGTQVFTLDHVRAITGCDTCEVSIRLEIDPDDVICECDGTDNDLCVGPFAIATPDLTITQIDTTGIVCSNDAIAGEVVLTIENTGCGDATAFDLALASDGCLTFSTQRIAGLNAGTQTTVSFPVASVWANCADCSCTFTATIDPASEICECDGANNALSTPFTSTTPDLEIPTATASLVCASDGESRVLVNLTVENTGCGPVDTAIAAQVTLYDGPNCTGTIVDQWTTELGTITVAAGESQAVSLPGHTIAEGLCTSDCGYSVRIELDPDNRVCECDGTDNGFCISPVISTTPNLIVTQIDPAIDCRTGTAQVRVTVENTGCGDATGVIVDLSSAGCSLSLTSEPADIAAGGSATFTLTYTPTCSSWNCDYTATADLATTVCECDGTDNSRGHSPYPGDGSIGDTVWFDADGDGIQDPGEDGIPNITVILEGDLDGDGQIDVTMEMPTAADGTYLFDGLPAGDYTVTVDSNTLPDGLAQTFDADGLGTPHTSSLGLALNEDNLDQDFGYRGTGSIGDTVWFDVDADGIQDAGELGIPNVTVTLRGDVDGDGIQETVSTATDANGEYLFDTLPAGNYTITVDAATLPPGLEQTYDYDGTGTAHTSDYALGAGEHNRDQDFGYAAPALTVDKIVADIIRQGMSVGITGPVEPGDLVVYRFLIENLGPVPAYNIGFSDTLPAGMTISTSPPADAGTYAVTDPVSGGSLGLIDGSSAFDVPLGVTLGPDATLSADFTARVSSGIDQGVSLVNTATATGEGQDGTPIPPSNELLGDTSDHDAEDPDADDTGIAVLEAVEPALSVDKTITDIQRDGESLGITGPVEPGDVVFYRFVIVNVGQGTAYDVEFTDTLPLGLRVETDAPGSAGTFTITEPSMSGSLGLADNVGAFTTAISAEIAGGATLTADFAARVTSEIVQGVDLVNTATARGVDGAGTPIPSENPVLGDTSDSDAEDPDADDTGIAIIAADEPALSVDKVITDILRQGGSIGSVGPVEPGDTVLYRYTIRNVGLGTAYAVDFTDTLPIGLEIETASPGHAGSWTVTEPATGGSLGLTDEATAFTTSLSATIHGGESLVAEYAVRVTSEVEQGVDLINVAATVGVDGAGNPIPGANADLGDTADDDAEDPDADDTGITRVTPREPALSVDKRITDVYRNGTSIGVVDPLLYEDVVEYTITVRNTGEGTAYGVELTDSLPAGLEVEAGAPGDPGSYSVSVPSSSGSLGLSDGVSSFATSIDATIEGGGTLTAVFTARITPSAPPSVDLINTVTATGRDGAGSPIPPQNAPLGDTSDDDEEDPDPDDTGIAILRVGVPALVTEKTVASIRRFGSDIGGATIEPGDRITYALTVTNVGDGPARNVNARDELPEGLVYEGASIAEWPSGTSSAPPIGVPGPDLIWNVNASLEPGEALVIRFEMSVPSDLRQGQIFVNRFSAAGEDAGGAPIPPDQSTLVPTDDDPDDQSDVELIAVEPALVTEKAVADIRRNGVSMGSGVPIQEGDVVLFDLRVTNVGGGTAYAVDLRDELPVPLQYVPDSTEARWPQRLGAFMQDPLGIGGQTLFWNTNATLGSGESIQLRFEALVAGPVEATRTYVNELAAIGVDGAGSPIPENNAGDVTADVDLDDRDRVELVATRELVPALVTDKRIVEIVRNGTVVRDGVIEAGDRVGFELRVENAGFGRAEDVGLIDDLPSAFDVLSGTSIVTDPLGSRAIEPNQIGQRLSWPLGVSLEPGEQILVRFQVLVVGPLIDGRTYVNRMAASGADTAGRPIPTDQSEKVPADTDPDDADAESLVARSPLYEGMGGTFAVPILRKAAEILGAGPCEGVSARIDRLWFQTDIALFAATEFEDLDRIAREGEQNPDTYLPTWIRTARERLSLDALDNLLQVYGLAEVGVPLEDGPRIARTASDRGMTPELALDLRLNELARVAGLSVLERPTRFDWIYLEYAGGEPLYETWVDTDWGPSGAWTVLDRGIDASALGMGLLKQAASIRDLLPSEDPEARYLGWVVCESMAGKLEQIRTQLLWEPDDRPPYVPHRWIRSEGAFRLEDAESRLFDQASLLLGAARTLTALSSLEASWPESELPLFEDLHLGARLLGETVLRTLTARHTMLDGTLISTANGSSSESATPVDLGFVLIALEAWIDAMGTSTETTRLAARAGDQLRAMQAPSGRFAHPPFDSEELVLADQLAGIRGLLAHAALVDDPDGPALAQHAFDALEPAWQEHLGLGVYATYVGSSGMEMCYTPLEIGLAASALTELAAISDPARSVEIIERLGNLLRSVVQEAALQLTYLDPESFTLGSGRGEILAPAGLADLQPAPVLQERLCLLEADTGQPCADWRRLPEDPFYQTDISMYAGTVLQDRLPRWSDVADANLVAVVFHSGLGHPLESWTDRSDPILETAASAITVLPFYGGDPQLDSQDLSLAWNEEGFDDRVVASALGMTLLREAQEADELLGLDHRTSTEDAELRGLLASILTKIEILPLLQVEGPEGVLYIPHQVEWITESLRTAPRTIDAQSTLFDQLSLVHGLTSAWSLFSEAEVEPWVRTLAREPEQIQDGIRSLLDNVLNTLEVAHRLLDERVLVDRTEPGLNAWRTSERVTLTILGLATEALDRAVDAFGLSDRLGSRALALLEGQVRFLSRELWDGSGGYLEAWTLAGIQDDSTCEPQTLTGQLAALRTLLIGAERLDTSIAEVVSTFRILDGRFWDPELGLFVPSIEATSWCMTPLDLGLAVGTLTRILDRLPTSEAIDLERRLERHVARSLDALDLQLPSSRYDPNPRTEPRELPIRYAPVFDRRVCVEPPASAGGDLRARVGDTVRYTIELENPTEDAFVDLTLVDLLPDGVRLVQAVPNGTVDPSGQSVTWSFDRLEPGERRTWELLAVFETETVEASDWVNCARLTYTNEARDELPEREACARVQPQELGHAQRASAESPVRVWYETDDAMRLATVLEHLARHESLPADIREAAHAMSLANLGVLLGESGLGVPLDLAPSFQPTTGLWSTPEAFLAALSYDAGLPATLRMGDPIFLPAASGLPYLLRGHGFIETDEVLTPAALGWTLAREALFLDTRSSSSGRLTPTLRAWVEMLVADQVRWLGDAFALAGASPYLGHRVALPTGADASGYRLSDPRSFAYDQASLLIGLAAISELETIDPDIRSMARARAVETFEQLDRHWSAEGLLFAQFGEEEPPTWSTRSVVARALLEAAGTQPEIRERASQRLEDLAREALRSDPAAGPDEEAARITILLLAAQQFSGSDWQTETRALWDRFLSRFAQANGDLSFSALSRVDWPHHPDELAVGFEVLEGVLNTDTVDAVILAISNLLRRELQGAWVQAWTPDGFWRDDFYLPCEGVAPVFVFWASPSHPLK